ncbi:MAG: 30S ribosomal protein S15 [Candidatus Pacebacteria bacterium]|nr:30S ribosomal protein S15 [Candidatus Paceibacterota bacterium]
MLTKRKKQTAIKTGQRHDKDTGSAEVQISILTKRISDLAAHLKTNHKDKHSRRGLLQLVANRHSLVRYLKKKDMKKFKALAKKVGIKS